ncbi:sulfite reductase subunit alpha [Lysobacter sp. A421]
MSTIVTMHPTNATAVPGRRGNLLLALMLVLLAIALAGWQVEPWQWIDPGRPRLLMAAAVVLAYLGFIALLGETRRRATATDIATQPMLDPDSASQGWLVAYASQFGQAEDLARRTAESLQQAGQQAAVVALETLDYAQLQNTRRALFVASTTGEGDAPDPAAAFVERTMGRTDLRLEHLSYGVLALGDSDYGEFCAFGHRLDAWLRDAGAQPLFDLIEVDDCDPGALRHWQYHLGQLGGDSDQPDWSRPRYRAWSLQERHLLNPGSPGGPVFDLALLPHEADELTWQAGDIAEVGPRHGAATVQAWLDRVALAGDTMVNDGAGPVSLAELVARSRLLAPESIDGNAAQAIADQLQPLPHRAYSIASIPAEGKLRLLVRQVWHPDNTPGIGSGWLTAHADPGTRIDLRIRRNESFHRPADDRPLVLIGNGTGLAGLRALLCERVQAGHHRNWVLFGERTHQHDFHYRDEFEHWHREGRIERLDLAFSRDQEQRHYVQHLVQARAEELRSWCEQGAAIYVCGSLQGMAPAVDEVLAQIVGRPALEAMTADGRYRRDVY